MKIFICIFFLINSVCFIIAAKDKQVVSSDKIQPTTEEKIYYLSMA